MCVNRIKKEYKNLAVFLFNLFLHSQNRNIAIYPVVLKGDSVAQLVEQYTFNVWVLGSSPSGITKKLPAGNFFLCLHPISDLFYWNH